MAGQEKGHEFVAELLVGHLAAVLRLRLQQHRQEIPRIPVAFAARANDAVNNRIQPAQRPVKDPIPGRHHARRQKYGEPPPPPRPPPPPIPLPPPAPLPPP